MDITRHEYPIKGAGRPIISRVVEYGGIVYVCGTLPEPVGDITIQTRQVLDLTNPTPTWVDIPGATALTYTPTVKSRKGGVKLKLESGPTGMEVTPQGSLTWKVPADFAAGEQNVILSITDSSGQEIFQTFSLTVKGK